MEVAEGDAGEGDAGEGDSGLTRNGAGRVARHALVDRIFHWLMAGSMLFLLGTGFLPILGVAFDWVVLHWAAGLVLIALIIFHTVHMVLFRSLGLMAIGPRSAFREAPRPFGRGERPGKYNLGQRAYHLAITLVLLTAAITGALMLIKQDTPLWPRNPYWLTDYQWGLIYVAHGLAALFALSFVTVHVYFAIRPEKLLYTRSMILGWIREDECRALHDPAKWPADRNKQ